MGGGLETFCYIRHWVSNGMSGNFYLKGWFENIWCVKNADPKKIPSKISNLGTEIKWWNGMETTN